MIDLLSLDLMRLEQLFHFYYLMLMLLRQEEESLDYELKLEQ
jgi:hypothetical protein